MSKIHGTGGNKKTASIVLKKEIMIRADLNVNDEVEVYVNSRKEVVIRKVPK